MTTDEIVDVPQDVLYKRPNFGSQPHVIILGLRRSE